MTFETQAIELLIDKMFNKNSHFSICDLDTLADAIGVNPKNHPNYKFLRALHCVHYKDMQPEFIEQLQQKVAQCVSPQKLLNPTLFAEQLMAEGNNFAGTEDTYLISHKV